MRGGGRRQVNKPFSTPPNFHFRALCPPPVLAHISYLPTKVIGQLYTVYTGVGPRISLSYRSEEGRDLLLTHGGDYLPSRQLQEGAGGDRTLWVRQVN